MGAYINQRLPEDEERAPIFNVPGIVVAFVAKFIAIHIATQFLDDETYKQLLTNFALVPGLFFTPAADMPVKLWLPVEFSVLTYAFLHADFTHLTFNVLGFVVFGTAVARRIGTLRFLGIMLVTTVAAAATHLALYAESYQPCIGVSGTVSGLMASAFRFILPHQNPVTQWPPPALPLFSRPVLTVTLIWSAINVFLGVTGFTPEGFGAAVAWEAHLGGFFAGLVFFPLFDRRRSWMG